MALWELDSTICHMQLFLVIGVTASVSSLTLRGERGKRVCMTGRLEQFGALKCGSYSPQKLEDGVPCPDSYMSKAWLPGP